MSLFELKPYSLMYILAMIFGFCFLNAENSRKKIALSSSDLLNLILISVVAGIVGARVYFVLFRWGYFSFHLAEIPAIRNGGLASHGGFIAGAAAGYFYLKRHKINFSKFADAAVPLVVLGEACVRFGNYINGEAHGRPTTVPWGMVFPPNTLAGRQFPHMVIHPTMLYQLFYNVIVFTIIWYGFRRSIYKEGFVAALVVILYSMGRYVIEGLRADSLYWGPFRIAQIMCIALIASMLVCIFRGRLWIKSPSSSEPDAMHTRARERYKTGRARP